MNTPTLYKKGSQGKTIAGMELHISSDNEIYARGNGICSGIMLSDGVVLPVVNNEGWLATGDEGYTDEAGFLYVSGNRKQQFKLANGYYYDPRKDENDISEKLQSAAMLCRDEAGNIHALSVKETLSDAEKSFLEHFKIRIFALSLSSVSLVKSLPLKRPYVFTPLSDAIFLRRQNM
jgi:long-subunit acyl-CoA synthetase (AMP-forming)